MVEGSDGKYYEYEYDALLESYVIHTMGITAPLFLDYTGKKLYAYLDDATGYIDYDDVIEAYVIASINRSSFNMHEYTLSLIHI